MIKHMALAVATALSLSAPVLADDILQKPWDEIVAQAKAEGEVVWYNWFQQPRFRELVAGFEAEYGIKVTIPDGDADGNRNKFIADAQRETGDIDVMSLSGDWLHLVDLSTSLVGPLDILPGYDKLRTRINGGDSEGYAVAYWGNQSGFAYDPTRIDEADLPQSFEDLTSYMAANPQSFAFNDLRNGGAGLAFMQTAIRYTVPEADLAAGNFQAGFDWLNAEKANYGFSASNADSLIRLNGGEFVIVSAWEDHLASLQKQGEVDARMKFYIPELGMPGGGNVVGIAANAPHKAAALVFIDWLTSAETQLMFADEMGASPVNADAVANSKGMVTAEQRGYSVDWFPADIAGPLREQYLEKVVLQ